MINRAVVIHPERGIGEIEKVRKQYDPIFEDIPAHITLVFPFKSNLTKEEVLEHCKESVTEIKSFEYCLKEFSSFPPDYIFLNISSGRNPFFKLNEKLYQRSLKKYQNEKIPFNPHVTVGRISDLKERSSLVKDLNTTKLTLDETARKICIYTIDGMNKCHLENTVALSAYQGAQPDA